MDENLSARCSSKCEHTPFPHEEQEDIRFRLRILSRNPPLILIALGFILVVAGYTSRPQNVSLIIAGWALVIIGVILQVFLWKRERDRERKKMEEALKF